MSITVNNGGSLHELSDISVNVGGALHSLDRITVNENGVLREIYSKESSDGLTWSLTGEDSKAEILSVSDDGYTVEFKSGNSSDTSMISNLITLNEGDVISRTAGISTSGGTSKHCVLRIFDESGEKIAEIQGTSYTIETTGRYRLGLTAFGVSGTQTGTSYYSATATAVITVS